MSRVYSKKWCVSKQPKWNYDKCKILKFYICIVRERLWWKACLIQSKDNLFCLNDIALILKNAVETNADNGVIFAEKKFFASRNEEEMWSVKIKEMRNAMHDKWEVENGTYLNLKN